MALAADSVAIVASNVSKNYSDGLFPRTRTQALNDVCFTLRRGEILGLVGPNGAGKTTLIKSILRLIRIDTGTITINGIDNRSAAWKSAVGYLPEDFRAEEHASPLEILRFVARLRSMPKAQAAERIQELLILFDMQSYKRRPLGTLSKGMLLRLGLAQAIIHRPSVLLLDEPTNGLDPVGKQMIFDLLGSLRKEGCAILLSSHQLSEVERLADRVAMMYHGKFSVLAIPDSNATAGQLEEEFFKQFREGRQ